MRSLMNIYLALKKCLSVPILRFFMFKIAPEDANILTVVPCMCLECLGNEDLAWAAVNSFGLRFDTLTIVT